MDEDPVDRLFAAAPEAFVAERAALAKALRADGDKAAADAVKALAKPTRAAWVVNQLVRGQDALVEALAAAAAGLAEAQDAALAGGGPAALRDATREGRDAVEALVDAVPGTESDATRGAVQATLHAALVDAETLAAVRSGRLVREQAAAGFGGAGVVVAGPVPTAKRTSAPKATSERASSGRAKAGTKPKAKRGQSTAPGAKRGTREGTHERRAARDAERAAREDRAREEREARAAREQEEREALEAREQEGRERQRQAALRAAKGAEAAAEAEVTAAEEDLERANAELAARRRALKDAKTRLMEAHRERRRAERPES